MTHSNNQPELTVNVFDPHTAVEYQHLRLCVCTAHKQTLTFNKDKVCVSVLFVFINVKDQCCFFALNFLDSKVEHAVCQGI